MVKYFLDTEFHEYHKQVKVAGIKIGKAIPTVDFISIGIVGNNEEKTLMPPYDVYSETVKIPKEYYAVSKEFNVKDAWNSFQLEINKQYPLGPKQNKVHWLRRNVLKPIFEDFLEKERGEVYKMNEAGVIGIRKIKDKFTKSNFKRLLKKYGKTNKQIAEEIHSFIYNDYLKGTGLSYPDKFNYSNPKYDPIFYAYFADYDWVVFAQLYGKMMNLPEGYPWYCNDLKQTSDEIYKEKKASYYSNTKDEAIKNTGVFLNKLSDHPDYPTQDNEHNALDDALWNKKLHEFLNTINK